MTSKAPTFLIFQRRVSSDRILKAQAHCTQWHSSTPTLNNYSHFSKALDIWPCEGSAESGEPDSGYYRKLAHRDRTGTAQRHTILEHGNVWDITVHGFEVTRLEVALVFVFGQRPSVFGHHESSSWNVR
jgi:hypothetical protein